MRTIRISDEVWEEISKRGKFGETADDVLKRVFQINERRNSMKELRIIGPGRPRYATKRQSVWISNNFLNLEYEDGERDSWPLSPPADKNWNPQGVR